MNPIHTPRLLLAILISSCAAASWADAVVYPAKPIQLIAQQPPGSASDSMTRVWADCIARELAHPVIVQNKPGANGLLAINNLKGQSPDGYTLMSIGMSQMSITPYTYKQRPYDPATDFEGIAILGTSPLVLTVPAGEGIARLADLEKLAKTTPGGINFGSPGKGSPAHLLTTALLDKVGVPGTHVPFVGEGAGLTGLIGKQIQAMTLVIGTAAQQVKAGKLVALAVFDSQRSKLLPDVPTIAELVPAAADLARPSWIAVVGKAGLPQPIAAKLNVATEQCRTNEQYKARMEAMNVTLIASAPADVRSWAARDAAVWRPLIDRLGLATE
ncbi:tripartite tricarboxylate transporter substrate binding protein [Variovorax guangxiensis]|uniref:Tripartite tricarboxylate transporter substrate binding protein n=1 Tax=Variovorax guangxiensis TaxID=1775474 RepID=A0A433MMX1_9BURK|nr:tripartite tricarboxylate transporter substrate binding protein [Variovorax guangxiensis]RUR69411.1 tripartite tricarboxylate transporter substrate binding protein [Variovorax guangxiensis]